MPDPSQRHSAPAHSSGDLLADRRHAWALASAAQGDHAGAASLLEQALERVPAWAPGWAALGEARANAGERSAALEAWRTARDLDPTGSLGADLRIARLRGETPPAMSETYVRALFDGYAPRFERHLVEQLGYRAPDELLRALECVAPGRRFNRALDLGCGTGLMGRALESRAAAIDGVDLSPAMVDAARGTGAYADVRVASIDAALADIASPRYDLVAAADVLVYVGDLVPVFRGVAAALAPGGLFAFTLQASDGADAVLGPDLRFAHGRRAIERIATEGGYALPMLAETSTRKEQGRPVPGYVVVAAPRPGLTRHRITP